MTTKAEKLKALDDLADYDHCFITPEGAAALAKPFGLTPKTYVAQANPREPKGLTLNDGRKQAEGIAAEVLARQICDHAGVKYPSMMGRGFQLRACLTVLRQHVEAGQ